MKFLKKINHILLFIFAVLILLYFGATFLIPFTFGIFLATLMSPFGNFLEKIKIPVILSSLISTLIVFIVVGGVSYLFFYQMSQFIKDLPAIKSDMKLFIESFQHQLSTMTGLSLEEQNHILQNRSDQIMNIIESQLTRFLGNIVDSVLKFLLVLIYVFLLLVYRNKIRCFIMMCVSKEKKGKAKVVIYKISKVVYQYLWGRAKVMTILGLMYYVTFLVFDIPFAILLTIFGALVTIIPYIGPFISGLLPILFSILYGKEFYDVLLFSGIIIVIQLVESYLLEPFIIGKEVKLNPLIIIVAVILGGMIWGIAGMILFVPMFAVIKIISNHNPNLKPIGYLFETSSNPR